MKRAMLRSTLAAAAALAGCGDEVTCPPELRVELRVADVITEDADPATDGVQTDVPVESTLPGGSALVLAVMVAGEVLQEYTATAAADGSARFTGVTVPIDGANLHVIGDAGSCGLDDDLRTVEVTVGAGCTPTFVEPPAANAFYAPLDVFTAAADGAAQAPGYQGDVRVRAPSGHDVRILLAVAGGPEEPIAAATVPDDGELLVGVTLPEGLIALRAECSVGGVGLRRSEQLAAFVDTVAPGCAMVAPVPGTSLTAGGAVTLTGRASGGDVTGEPAAFELRDPDGTMRTIAGTALDAGGESSAQATFATPGDVTVRFTARDHAGNACTATAAYPVIGA